MLEGHELTSQFNSGPAASALGAWHLVGRHDVWTVDVGGTTADIAALRGGWPILNR